MLIMTRDTLRASLKYALHKQSVSHLVKYLFAPEGFPVLTDVNQASSNHIDEPMWPYLANLSDF